MKALLLKDYYMLQTSGRMNSVTIVLFLVLAVFAEPTMFFLSFAVLFAAMTPLTFLSIDEKDKWSDYSRALPYSRNDVVSSTYAFNLIMTVVLMLISIFILCLKNISHPVMIDPSFLLTSALSLLLIGLFPAILIYPIIFWLGTEKGRIVYMGLMAIVYAFFFVMVNQAAPEILAGFNQSIEIIAFACILLLYSGSWALSIYLYGRRLKKA